MSECITTTCPHKRGAFIWLGDGPDESGRYPWVHDTMTPGSRGLAACELMEFATAAEAGEACARCGCGSHDHRQPQGPIPFGVSGRDRGPCQCGQCPGMAYRTTSMGRELAVAGGWGLR